MKKRGFEVHPDAGVLPVSRRLAVALELHQMGVEMRRQRHRREHPEASPEEVEQVVGEWLRRRVGAPDGDVAGPVRRRI